MSRKDKKYAKRDKEAYPPRIVLTISEMKHVLFRSSATQLRIKVTGIAEQSSVCQGFNLPLLHRIKRGMFYFIRCRYYYLNYQTKLSYAETMNIQAAVDSRSADPPAAGGPGK
jgi:hypothetical protein